MIETYLHNSSYKNGTIDDVVRNLSDLNQIQLESYEDDNFYYHQSIWEQDLNGTNFSDAIFSRADQFTVVVLPKIMQRMKIDPSQAAPVTIADLDNLFGNRCSVYYGLNNLIQSNRFLDGLNAFRLFKDGLLRNISSVNFWEHKEHMFPNLIFCPSVEKDIKGVRDYDEVKRDLFIFDKYVAVNHIVRLQDVKTKTVLDISDESRETMNNPKYKEQRKFYLPDGSSEYFTLHIKPTLATRIHFLPKGDKVYIGYIGKHLDTVKFHD